MTKLNYSDRFEVTNKSVEYTISNFSKCLLAVKSINTPGLTYCIETTNTRVNKGDVVLLSNDTRTPAVIRLSTTW